MTIELDDNGHESLTRAILAKTSGGGCHSARQRLCDFVDDALSPLDRNLVDGHLANCPGCAALAEALAETASALPSFAALEPPTSIVDSVLSMTSRRPFEPTIGERLSAWLARAAARPRFSIEVAYVLTVLLLVVLGNPVDAFREATVRVEPRVTAVAEAVSGPLAEARAAGKGTLSSLERAIGPTAEKPGPLERGKTLVFQLWQQYVDGPARAVVLQVRDWAVRAVGELRAIVGAVAAEPPPKTVR